MDEGGVQGPVSDLPVEALDSLVKALDSPVKGGELGPSSFFTFKRKRDSESSPSPNKGRRGDKSHSPTKSPGKKMTKRVKSIAEKEVEASETARMMHKKETNATSNHLHAASLISVTSPKVLHVDQQNRFVIDSRIAKAKTRGQIMVTYKIRSDKDGIWRRLVLRDMWAQIDWLTQGTIINVVGVEADENNTIILEQYHGFLIVEPDRLISSTSVVGQLYCARKAAFYRISFYSDNTLILRGVIAHELICAAMVDRIDDAETLKKIVKRMCRRPEMLERAYGCGLSDEDLEKIQNEVVPWVIRFMKKRFLATNPDPKYQDIKFLDVVGVEDTVWNPSLGLKGKIDATVEIQKDDQKKILPLEFKTGSTMNAKRAPLKTEHMGQVALYTLMMSIKYGSVDEALLYYISDDSFHVLPNKKLELQHMIVLRNNFLRNSTLVDGQYPYLPRPNEDFNFKCKSCELRNLCTLDVKKKEKEYEGFNRSEKLLLDHFKLTEEEMQFFDDWFQVINAETQEVEKKYNDKFLWTKTSEEREAAGTCISNLQLRGECTPYKDSGGKISFLVSLGRRTPSQMSLIDMNMKLDDFVAFSSNVELNINYARIGAIKPDEITLVLDQPLHEEYFKNDFTYSIDKINLTSPIASQYGYLLKLMEDTPEAARLREYIIMKRQPKFGKIPPPDRFLIHLVDDLNLEQKRVVSKAFTTDSFLFVKGIPGSGKTTTIVSLLRALVYYKKTVLVVSYTGSALENILNKYKKFDKNFIKISTNGRADAAFQENMTKTISMKVKGVDELTEALNKPVVGTTLLSLKHPIFQNRKFDYCIVDEASQALPTTVFGALSCATKYVVFGDPNQLPPVMQSSLLRTKNLPDNFFSLMATPQSTVVLTTQYRMNKGITKLANELVYDNQMKCGSESQERAYIKLPEAVVRGFLMQKTKSIAARQVLCRAVSKKPERAVIFLDTSDIPAYESRVDDTVANEFESFITVALCRLFVESNLLESELGIIAPYRGQVNMLRRLLSKMENDAYRYHAIEVNTVDQYQGREMEVVICSFTKSLPPDSPFYEIGETKDAKVNILEDMRRLNVAITRAQRKLVLIGNQNTLRMFTPFQKLFTLLDESQVCQISIEAFQGLQMLVQAGMAADSD